MILSFCRDVSDYTSILHTFSGKYDLVVCVYENLGKLGSTTLPSHLFIIHMVMITESISDLFVCNSAVLYHYLHQCLMLFSCLCFFFICVSQSQLIDTVVSRI